jgi:DNA-binding NarL/FixJ family response regulator
MDMGAENSVALIAAGQGNLRDALRAMLHSMPGVSVTEVDDTDSAISALGRIQPQIVVIDSALPRNHSMELIKALQGQRPRVRCAILVDTVGQQAAAMRAGADRAPLKGEPAPRLFAQVEQLLRSAQLAAG